MFRSDYKVGRRVKDTQTGLTGTIVGYDAAEKSQAWVMKVEGNNAGFIMADPCDFVPLDEPETSK